MFFLQLYENLPLALPIQNVTVTRCFLSEMLPRQNAIYPKCYLDKKVSIRNVTYTKCMKMNQDEMLPIQSVRR